MRPLLALLLLAGAALAQDLSIVEARRREAGDAWLRAHHALREAAAVASQTHAAHAALVEAERGLDPDALFQREALKQALHLASLAHGRADVLRRDRAAEERRARLALIDAAEELATLLDDERAREEWDLAAWLERTLDRAPPPAPVDPPDLTTATPSEVEAMALLFAELSAQAEERARALEPRRDVVAGRVRRLESMHRDSRQTHLARLRSKLDLLVAHLDGERATAARYADIAQRLEAQAERAREREAQERARSRAQPGDGQAPSSGRTR